jgi:hypothetical protein
MPSRGGRDRESRDARYGRLPRDRFQPLRITAWLQSPIITDGTLPIDAVLYFVAHRATCPEQVMTISGALREGRSGASLPLARKEEHGPGWYYAASFAEWPESLAEGSDHWNCRIDESLCYLIDFRGRRGKIDIASAAYKSYHMPVYYRHALFARWYVVGEPVAIRNLLRFAPALGKKTSQGWGSVLRWEVETWQEDWSVRREDGKLMRAVPKEGGILAGYRPSYWSPRNQAPCEMPALR